MGLNEITFLPAARFTKVSDPRTLKVQGAMGSALVYAASEKILHDWHERSNLTCCRRCGIVKNVNNEGNWCRGQVKVALR